MALVTLADLTTYMDITLSLRQQDAAELILNGLQAELEAYLRRPIELANFTDELHTLPSDHMGLPLTSFFYTANHSDELVNSVGEIIYTQPPTILPLRNTPVASVSSVYIYGLSTGKYLAEAVERTATVTNVARTVSTVTYTVGSGHNFTKGQYLTTTGITPSVYNLASQQILSVTTTAVSISNPNPDVIDGPYSEGGTAVATGSDYVVHRWGLELFRGFANDKVAITYTGGLDGDEIPVLKLMILRAAAREMQNLHDDVVGIKDLSPRGVAVMETGFLEKELAAIKRYRRHRIS